MYFIIKGKFPAEQFLECYDYKKGMGVFGYEPDLAQLFIKKEEAELMTSMIGSEAKVVNAGMY